MARRYITTAIDYPNAAPHMGHVLEKVLADVAARWFRLRGDDVQFQIGTDEHGIKIQRTAEKEGVEPQPFVDKMVPLFEELYARLHISHDYFIRTSDTEAHWPTVKILWQRLADAGALEKRSYTGLYCAGCERFMTQRDLIDGVCPNHQVAPEEVTEENWFFLLSRHGDDLKALLTTEKGWDGETYKIVPSFRENETLSLIEQGLEDVSFSRPQSSLSWGVPVPEDEEQTMYVWCDALTNYISGLGLLTDNARTEFWDDAVVTHVIGKDIARFHALIWPAMLKLGDVRTPDELLIHGFLTSEGEKMSKSLGNVVVPTEVLDRFGGNPDPIRFYLSHEVPVGRDGDFSWERFEALYDSKLRNQLGNLLNRVLVLLRKEGGEIADVSASDDASLLASTWDYYSDAMDRYAFSEALGMEGVFKIVDHYNRKIDEEKPWEKEGEEKKQLLSVYAEGLRHTALMISPFMPETARRMSVQLGMSYAEEMAEKSFVISDELKKWGGSGDWKEIGESEILFAPLES